MRRSRDLFTPGYWGWIWSWIWGGSAWLASGAISAHALEATFHGKAFTDQYVYTQGTSGGTLAQSNLSFWPELAAKIDDAWSAKAVIKGNLFFASQANPKATTASADVREFYISYLKSGIELRAGQLIIPWGKSDGINPTDYFTAKDYTFFNPDEEFRRLGELSLSLSFTPHQGDSPWNLQVVAQARDPQNKMLVPPQNLPSGLTLNSTPAQPAYFSTGVQAGVRLQYLGNKFDGSISGFRGRSAFPVFQFESASRSIVAVNPMQSAVGADASFNLGESSVVRIETAFLLPDNGTNQDPYFGVVQPWHWDSVIGVERTFGDYFRVQAQFLARYYLYYQSPSAYNDGNATSTAIEQAVGAANVLVLNYPSQWDPGATLRVAYSNEAYAWSGEVYLIGYFASGSAYLLRPVLGYKPADDIKIQVGADWYGGNSALTLGALANSSAGFVEGKWEF